MKYQGDIKGFPQHVVEAMLDEQERQGNKRDVAVFYIQNICVASLGGFDWDKSILGDEVWRDVICDEQFHLIQKPKKEKFPFRVEEDNIKRIINIACNDWKPRLAKKWGKDLLMQGYVEVSEHFYNEMRKACTEEQNVLFDEIFGKDEEFIPDGTPCLVTDDIIEGWSLRYADGNGKFYGYGKKKGMTESWDNYQLLDINNLPVNK